jgi:2-C-methyl-D-erythritol 4-phosphate cytidylyltransferase
MSWGVVVVAAGRGTRFGGPKQLVALGGRPMLSWSLLRFAAMPEIEHVVVVTEESWLGEVERLAREVAGARLDAVVPGGATRQESVRRGLDALDAACTRVLVHDGARPLVRAEDVRLGMAQVAPGRGAVLGAPVIDTIKLVDPSTMLVVQTLERECLWGAQTPQFAMRDDLARAHASARERDAIATDDVALLEAIGIAVVVVPASGDNFKVTHPGDLARAEALLR